MKCEICKERDVDLFIIYFLDGKSKEIACCFECAIAWNISKKVFINDKQVQDYINFIGALIW